MKTFAVVAGAVLLALAGFFGYKTLSASHIRTAIVKVLEARQGAHRANVVMQKPLLGPPIKRLNVNGFISSLTKIKTEDCPPDFRRAWISYVQSFERARDGVFVKQQNLLERNTKLTVRGELGANTGATYESEHANYLTAAEHLAKFDHEEMLRTLERIVSGYGIDPLQYEDN